MSTPKRRRDEDVSDAPLTLREAETSLRGAAALREALARHSYAVVALDAADALAVRQCAEAGLAYFRAPEATKRTHRHVFSDAGGAGLCGWNKPHAAKEVLRLRRGGPPPPVDAAAAFDVVERCACAACHQASISRLRCWSCALWRAMTAFRVKVWHRCWPMPQSRCATMF